MDERTYNIIANPEQSRSQSGLFGGAQSDDSAAPNFGGTATVEQLQAQYQDDPYLQSTFGSFDNYISYMGEANDMLGAQDWWNNTGIDKRTRSQIIREGDDLGMSPGQQTDINDLRQSNYNARQSGYNSWLNSEENQALMQQYGIEPTIVDEKGDTYTWTGNGYMRTNINEDSRLGFNDVVKAGIVGTIGAGLGGAAGTALGGSLGLGSTASGMLSGGLGGLTTGALNGDITAEGIISGALIGGLNPGGMLATDAMGFGPNSFVGGFIEGGTNSLIAGGIQNGELDFDNALKAGLLNGTLNSVVDYMFRDPNQNSIEAHMERIKAAHKLDYKNKNGSLEGYVPLSNEAAYNQAITIPHAGTSDLGGLVGDDGLFSFIPAPSTTPMEGFNEFLFGTPGGVQIFLDPEGNQITEVELLNKGYSPYEVWDTTRAGGNIDGYTYAGVSVGRNNVWDQLVDKTFESSGLNTILDGASLAYFEDKYGFDPRENPELAQTVLAYGELDERYTWAPNPRGDSEYYGIMSALPDTISMGSTWGYTGPGVDDAGNPLNQIGDVLVLNTPPPSTGSGSGAASFAPDGTGQTLPGSNANYTMLDAYINGLLTGSDSNANTNTEEVLGTLPDSDQYYGELPMAVAAGGLLPSSDGGGDDGDKGGRSSSSKIDEDPKWGDLYQVGKVSRWQRARERLYNDMTKGMLS